MTKVDLWGFAALLCLKLYVVGSKLRESLD